MAILSFAQRAEYASNLPDTVLQAVANGESPEGPYNAATDLVGPLSAGAELGIRNRFYQNEAVMNQKEESERKNRELGLGSPPEPDIVSKIVAESRNSRTSPVSREAESGQVPLQIPREGQAGQVPLQNVYNGGIMGLANGGGAQDYTNIPDSLIESLKNNPDGKEEIIRYLMETGQLDGSEFYDGPTWGERGRGITNFAWDMLKPEHPYPAGEDGTRDFNPWGALDWGVMGLGGLTMAGSGGFATPVVAPALAAYKTARKSKKGWASAKALANLVRKTVGPGNLPKNLQRMVTSRGMPSWLGGRSWKGKQDTIAQTIGRWTADAGLDPDSWKGGIANLLSRSKGINRVPPAGTTVRIPLAGNKGYRNQVIGPTSFPLDTARIGDWMARRGLLAGGGSAALFNNMFDVGENVVDDDTQRYFTQTGGGRSLEEQLSPEGEKEADSLFAKTMADKAERELEEYLASLPNENGSGKSDFGGDYESILETIRSGSGGASTRYKDYIENTLLPRLTTPSATERDIMDNYNDLSNLTKEYMVSGDTIKGNSEAMVLAALSDAFGEPGSVMQNLDVSTLVSDIGEYQEATNRKNMELGIMANQSDTSSLTLQAGIERSGDLLDQSIYEIDVETESQDKQLAMEYLIRQAVAEIQANASLTRSKQLTPQQIESIFSQQFMLDNANGVPWDESLDNYQAMLDAVKEQGTP